MKNLLEIAVVLSMASLYSFLFIGWRWGVLFAITVLFLAAYEEAR